jgi:predicted alpha/beta-hydrolase family hydrolase
VSPDLDAATDAGIAAGLEVVRFEQPWRLAGRKVAVAPPRLDEAWLALLASLDPLPTVLGGRSAGARVACRTAASVPHAVGVLCLAFPLQPPSGRPSRQAELDLPALPVLVVQGGRDGFGVPVRGPGREVVVVPGADHSFTVRRVDGVTRGEVRDAVRGAVGDWLAVVLDTGQALT